MGSVRGDRLPLTKKKERCSRVRLLDSIMNETIDLLRDSGKTDEVFDISNPNYLYHGKYIPYFNDSSKITSIIEMGILTIKDQYQNGLISLEEIKNAFNIKTEGLLNQIKYKIDNKKCILSLKKNNITFFSPNRNLFNRVFDISFVVMKDSSFVYLDSNLVSEIDSTKMISPDVYTEYIKNGSVSPEKFLAIKINLDELLTPECVEKRGVSIDEVISRVINMVNDIYDKLEETNLNIPIINSNDGKVLNKALFRNLREDLITTRKK